MTATPHINDVVNQAKDDLKAMSSAARADFQRLRSNAGELAQEHLLKPAKDATDWVGGYVDQSADDIRDYTTRHPLRALAIAAAGGVILSFFLSSRR